MNVFMLSALFVSAASIVLAGGTFLYEKYLASASANKAEELKQAEASISNEAVEDFLRLRNRLVSAEMLLDQHVALSRFLNTLEDISVKNVQFNSLSMSVNPDRTAKIDMAGTAATFNALAFESAEFAKEKLIRRAIFSGISADEKGLVSFTLTAELDPKMVVWDGVTVTGTAPPDIEVPPPTE